MFEDVTPAAAMEIAVIIQAVFAGEDRFMVDKPGLGGYDNTPTGPPYSFAPIGVFVIEEIPFVQVADLFSDLTTHGCGRADDISCLLYRFILTRICF